MFVRVRGRRIWVESIVTVAWIRVNSCNQRHQSNGGEYLKHIQRCYTFFLKNGRHNFAVSYGDIFQCICICVVVFGF
jgi:hypothetical protein